MAPNSMRRKIAALLATGLAVVLLFVGCAPAAPAAPAPSEGTAATPQPAVELSSRDQRVLDSFCDDWNKLIDDQTSDEDAEDVDTMQLDSDKAVVLEEEHTMPAGTISCQLAAGRSTVTIYLLDGELIAADCTSLTRDWRKGGYSDPDPSAGREWQAAWKTMVLCLNNNQETPGYTALLADIAKGMPRAVDQQNSQRGEIVTNGGWEYRMANLERNKGVMYDKRVRACSMEYADELSSWMDWL